VPAVHIAILFISYTTDHRVSRPTGWHPCFVFGRPRVQHLTQSPAVLTDDFLGPFQFLQTCRDSILNQATTASFYILSNSLFSNHPTIRRGVIWCIDSVVK
jgi:hypothetical protein